MLNEIGSYLQAQGVGTLGSDIILGLMPDQPDNCIALFEYAGSPPDLHWNGEYPGLQVRVRNKSYGQGRAKIGQIVRLLHGLHETELNGTRYLLLKARGSPEVLQRDGSNRTEWVVNFEIHVGINYRLGLLYKNKMLPTLIRLGKEHTRLFWKECGFPYYNPRSGTKIRFGYARWNPELNCYCYQSRIPIPMKFNDPKIYGIAVEGVPKRKAPDFSDAF